LANDPKTTAEYLAAMIRLQQETLDATKSIEAAMFRLQQETLDATESTTKAVRNGFWTLSVCGVFIYMAIRGHIF